MTAMGDQQNAKALLDDMRAAHNAVLAAGRAFRDGEPLRAAEHLDEAVVLARDVAADLRRVT